MQLLRFVIFAPVLVALVMAGGCASVTRGTKDTLVVETTPAGADVRLSTGGAGKSPTSFKLPRKQELDVFIEKEGYEPLTVHVSSQVSGTGAAGMAGNVLVGGLIGAGVDVWTGATKDLRPNPIKVVMVPRTAPPAQVAAATSESGKPAEGQGTGTTPAADTHSGASGGGGELVAKAEFKATGKQVGTLRAPKMNAAEVQDAICATFSGREWEVTDKGIDHVTAHIKRRSSEAILTVTYDAELIQLYCEGWKIDKKTGERLKPSLPDSWIENIREDLTARLNHVPVS